MRVAACWIALAMGCDRTASPTGAPPSSPTAGTPLTAAPSTASGAPSTPPAGAPEPVAGPSAPAAGSSAPSGPGSPTAAGPSCAIAPLPLRVPAPKRLVAIGDLHGDLGGARAALRAAGAIDAYDHWVGGELVVVQTGDVLDRGDDERALLDLIPRLEARARTAGGALVMLLGNHELMNAAGDFRYVTPAGLHAFDDVATTRPGSAAAAAPASASGPAIAASSTDAAEASRSRLAALGPGGRYAHLLAGHAVIAIVGDTVFSHAGVLGGWTGRVDEVNRSARCWLDGQAPGPPAALTADDSPVWTRAAGVASPDCAALRQALDALGVKRMVVGHTVQDHGITSACDGALWRIDVGLARHYGGPIEVLELARGAAPKVLAGTRD